VKEEGGEGEEKIWKGVKRQTKTKRSTNPGGDNKNSWGGSGKTNQSITTGKRQNKANDKPGFPSG